VKCNCILGTKAMKLYKGSATDIIYQRMAAHEAVKRGSTAFKTTIFSMTDDRNVLSIKAVG